MALHLVILLSASCLVAAQRPFFAGTKPIGYPAIATSTADDLGNRFGEDNVTTTTQRLPIEALGDKDLVDRLSKLPKDKQPFWLLNWQALEEQRKNPQTYPQRPSQFAEPLNPSLTPPSSNPPNGSPSFTNANTGFTNSPGFTSTGFSSVNPNVASGNFGFTNAAATDTGATSASGLGNRFGSSDVKSETTHLTMGQVLTPTYPLYAHIDDALGNKYFTSQNNQTGSLINDSRAKHTTFSNKPVNRNLAKENSKLPLDGKTPTKFVNMAFFYVPPPPPPMIKESIYQPSLSNFMVK